ncbi:MAG TPA: hypothetical protein VFT67_17625 [Jatrophihabitantaceae bacterium]|nr:hypothetical protein [Jatrophihabitantaceae bacterium]
MKRSLIAFALVALFALALPACSPFPSHHLPTRIGPLPSSTPAITGQTPGAPGVAPGATDDGDLRAPPGPDVVRFGVQAGMLFVEVENRSTAWIKAARVLITARGAAGDTIVAATGRLGSRCCTIYALPPGRRYGLFVSLRGSTEPVASVEVTYLDRSVVAGRRGRVSTVAVRHPVLRIRRGDAVVRATLVTRHHTGPYVVGQAFLADRRGRLVGVISGRFYCFRPNAPKTVFMHLLHPVPHGTRIVGTAAYSVPAGEPTGVGYRCQS